MDVQKHHHPRLVEAGLPGIRTKPTSSKHGKRGAAKECEVKPGDAPTLGYSEVNGVGWYLNADGIRHFIRHSPGGAYSSERYLEGHSVVPEKGSDRPSAEEDGQSPSARRPAGQHGEPQPDLLLPGHLCEIDTDLIDERFWAGVVPDLGIEAGPGREERACSRRAAVDGVLGSLPEFPLPDPGVGARSRRAGRSVCLVPRGVGRHPLQNEATQPSVV